jgi:hypothetical protein
MSKDDADLPKIIIHQDMFIATDVQLLGISDESCDTTGLMFEDNKPLGGPVMGLVSQGRPELVDILPNKQYQSPKMFNIILSSKKAHIDYQAIPSKPLIDKNNLAFISPEQWLKSCATAFTKSEISDDVHKAYEMRQRCSNPLCQHLVGITMDDDVSLMPRRLLNIKSKELVVLKGLCGHCYTRCRTYGIISYVWNRKTTWFNGESLPIKGVPWAVRLDADAPQRLFYWLDYIHVNWPDLEYVWVDSLCLNQVDTEDSNDHLPHMGRYYRNARYCFGILDTVQSCACHPWFERAWTLPETVLPSRTILCMQGWEAGHLPLEDFLSLRIPNCASLGYKDLANHYATSNSRSFNAESVFTLMRGRIGHGSDDRVNAMRTMLASEKVGLDYNQREDKMLCHLIFEQAARGDLSWLGWIGGNSNEEQWMCALPGWSEQWTSVPGVNWTNTSVRIKNLTSPLEFKLSDAGYVKKVLHNGDSVRSRAWMDVLQSMLLSSKVHDIAAFLLVIANTVSFPLPAAFTQTGHRHSEIYTAMDRMKDGLSSLFSLGSTTPQVERLFSSIGSLDEIRQHVWPPDNDGLIDWLHNLLTNLALLLPLCGKWAITKIVVDWNNVSQDLIWVCSGQPGIGDKIFVGPGQHAEGAFLIGWVCADYGTILHRRGACIVPMVDLSSQKWYKMGGSAHNPNLV